MRHLLVAASLALFGAGCTPHNAAEAEAKRDVDWLAKDGTPESVAALGRLADKDDRAVAELTTLAAEPESDAGRGPLDVYIAAWAATERKAPWGAAMLQRGLGDPASAPHAAEAMKRGALDLVPLLPALEGALRSGCGVSCGGAIASVTTNDVAAVVKRRLDDAATRDAMCGGLASREASSAAAAVYVSEPAEARNAQACVDAAAPLAARDDAVLAWLGASAEPALLGAASRGEPLPCARLQRAWESAFRDRPRAVHEALALPLASAVKRCPKEMDGVLAAALTGKPEARALAVSGLLDPASTQAGDLKVTCAALPNAARDGSALTRSRATEALARCARR